MNIEQENTWDTEVKLYEKYMRHGGPWDRGSADSYYSRGQNPHYYEKGTGTSPLVERSKMTAEEIEAYRAGYAYNERFGDKKNWK